MYSEAAIERRRCTATTQAGAPCRAFALWGDGRQVCAAHSGCPKRPYATGRAPRKEEPPTRYVPCTCIAYAWPHRPGGGLCRWPDPPEWQRLTPAGTHAEGRSDYDRWWRKKLREHQAKVARERRRQHADG